MPLINIGTVPNDGTGDSLFITGQKLNREPNPVNTINADSGDYIGTKEQKITAAIVDAGLKGYKFVWIPSSMLPYNASLVTFNNTIRMIRQGARWDVCDIRAYGAAGDGVTDDSIPIDRADAAACDNSVGGLDGVTVMAQSVVWFPQGIYQHTQGLTYRGAPWVGEGINVTSLRFTGSAGAAYNATGTSPARRILNVREIYFDGSQATGTAYGWRLGWNQRSPRSLEACRVAWFPLYGIFFAGDTWDMRFLATHVMYNKTIGIYKDVSVQANAIDWIGCLVEQNGANGSGFAGGAELDQNCNTWGFHGGAIESNLGDADMRFTDCDVSFYSMFIETGGVPPTGGIDGIVFQGTSPSAKGVFSGCKFVAAVPRASGTALRVRGTSSVTIDNIYMGGPFPTQISVENTAKCTLLSPGIGVNVITVAPGASFCRVHPKEIGATETILVSGIDATQGNVQQTTLTAARLVGAPLNPSIKQRITFTFVQDGTGGRNVTWNAVFKVSWSDTGNTLNKRSSISFIYDGTSWNQDGAQTPYV
jgi:Pectate lyase superfamily protein